MTTDIVRRVPRSLDLVVTTVATTLMAASAADSARVSQLVLADLVAYFEVDICFLRHNDHIIRASRLIAEWPPRNEIPEPDPLALIYFADADPVFAMSEHGKTPQVFRPEPATDDYQRLIKQGSGIPATSMAAAPLVSGDLTTGVLGFVKLGDRAWSAQELNALEAIGSLFAQLQARVLAEEQLQFFAEHDDLTGVHNRRALLRHLDDRLEAGQSGPVALLFIDVDRLKTINDYLGHTAGDWFIQTFAERLRASTIGLIARFGGDEFFVVPPAAMGADVAESLARRLQEETAGNVDIDGETLTRTLSVGLALGIPGTDSTSDLLRRADEALHAAKKRGGNTVAVYTEDMSRDSALRNDIELRLHGVVESGELLLHYQPEVDLRTGEILAAEALVRWQHPTRGLLLPDAFIGVVESMNLAGELGRWVLRAACADLSRWRSQGLVREQVLRVNVSPAQLISDGFVGTVADTLDEYGLEAESVCLEITESVLVRDIDTTRITLDGLKEVGVQVAIDDFGTGYSSLAQLKSLPVDTLKIDQGFVRELGNNASDLAIVRAIIALAQAFGLQLVAEGVETAIAAETLLQLGCHRAQGFLFSRPIASDALETLLAIGRITLYF